MTRAELPWHLVCLEPASDPSKIHFVVCQPHNKWSYRNCTSKRSGGRLAAASSDHSPAHLGLPIQQAQWQSPVVSSCCPIDILCQVVVIQLELTGNIDITKLSKRDRVKLDRAWQTTGWASPRVSSCLSLMKLTCLGMRRLLVLIWYNLLVNFLGKIDLFRLLTWRNRAWHGHQSWPQKTFKGFEGKIYCT